MYGFFICIKLQKNAVNLQKSKQIFLFFVKKIIFQIRINQHGLGQ